MKQVSLREFQLHPSKYIDSLPIVLTRYNLPIATLLPWKEAKKGKRGFYSEDLVYKSRNGDVPIELNEAVPFGKVLVKNVTGSMVELDINSGESREIKSEWPTSHLGKPLSGKTGTCPICYKNTPVEFAQEHYQKEHGDI